MSCMPISPKALLQVCATLEASYCWFEQTNESPLGLFTKLYRPGRFNCNLKYAQLLAREFCMRAFIFNAIEYDKGKEAEENAEPIEWGTIYRLLKNNRDFCRLDIMQLYVTLKMWDYNTHPEGWLEHKDYENWARREEYEDFKSQLSSMIHYLSDFIVTRLPEYQLAKWDL